MVVEAARVVWAVLVLGVLGVFVYSAGVVLVALVVRRGPRRGASAAGWRWAVVICAHNEVGVIGRAVRSARLVAAAGGDRAEVLVCADRCSDETAEAARDAGAWVWERKAGRPGKQVAIAEFIGSGYWLRNYSGVVFLDADNLCGPGMFAALRDGLASGCDAVQARLGVSNRRHSWVSRAYAVFYRINSWYYFWSRGRLGHGQLGGTGWACRPELLAEVPMRDFVSQTEDLEYTLRLVLAGKRVGFVGWAEVLDEKPLGLWASMRQRARWCRGGYRCLGRYGGAVWAGSWRSWRLFDLWVYLASHVVGPVQSALVLVGLLSLGGWVSQVLYIGALNVPAWLAYGGFGFGDLWGVLVFPLWYASWLACWAWGLATVRSGSWEHTAHVGA